MTEPIPTVLTAEENSLMEAAREAYNSSWSPYSKFKVGAAILIESGEVFTGCNVENMSYGLTNCAERTAIFSAVARRGGAANMIRTVAVAAEQPVACAPCGACRQVIYEFGPDATIIFRGERGLKRMHIRELLPEGFGFSPG